MARGSIFKKNDRWAFRVDAGVDSSTGKRRQMLRQGFKTKREAETALAAAQQSVEKGTVVSKSSMKVDAWLDDWLASQRHRVKESTHHSYVITSKRIRSGLGHVQVQLLTPLQIEAFYSDLVNHGRADGTGLSPKTVRNTHTVLRKALADAERLGIVHRNAAASARGPKVERPEFNVWSDDEVKRFLAAAKENRLYAAFFLLVTTGMRRGEALGLRWSDLNLGTETGAATIAQTLTNVDGRLTFGTPKTRGSRRLISLDPRTVEELRRHRSRQAEEQLRVGPDWEGLRDLVFTDEVGRPVRPEWLSKDFGRIAEAARVPRIRLHDLRHTYATIAMKEGEAAKVVSERLGHSTINITLDLYSHVTDGIHRESANRMADKLVGD